MPGFRVAGLILSILVLLWPSKGSAQSTALDTAKIDVHVEAVMASSRIPGVALGIVHEDRIVYLKGYGDAGNGGPVTPKTLFDLASVSKPFTALAVMQLMEDGKVDLDQPVQEYLPEFQLADATAAARITVRHLLSHVSGLSTFSGRQHFFSENNSPEALAEYVRDLKDVRPTAPVGSKFQYSNSNSTRSTCGGCLRHAIRAIRS
jgi:CubicO group peptidase (beta-lactamase class C family)